MAFELYWTARAAADFAALGENARVAAMARAEKGKTKSSKAEGVFNQARKVIALLANDPRHPGLHCHEYDSLKHPYKEGEKVWEAYVQNQTSGAYRLFWCYGPDKGQITVIAITPHP